MALINPAVFGSDGAQANGTEVNTERHDATRLDYYGMTEMLFFFFLEVEFVIPISYFKMLETDLYEC